MSIFTGIILYILIYWVSLFMVLPWGNRAPEGDELTVGHAGSAPVNPHIKMKFLVTGVVAAVLWVVVFTLIKMDVIDFYQIARTMSEEDLKQ